MPEPSAFTLQFYACEMVLEEEGIYGGESGWDGLGRGPWVPADALLPTDVSCDEWAFSLLPLDVDLLSMELPEFFRDYFLVTLRADAALTGAPLVCVGRIGCC